MEKESGEGGKVDAKHAVKMLAQKQKDLLEVKLAEKSKQQSDKAKGIDSSSEITNVKDRSAKKIVVDSAPGNKSVSETTANDTRRVCE